MDGAPVGGKHNKSNYNSGEPSKQFKNSIKMKELSKNDKQRIFPQEQEMMFCIGYTQISEMKTNKLSSFKVAALSSLRKLHKTKEKCFLSTT